MIPLQSSHYINVCESCIYTPTSYGNDVHIRITVRAYLHGSYNVRKYKKNNDDNVFNHDFTDVNIAITSLHVCLYGQQHTNISNICDDVKHNIVDNLVKTHLKCIKISADLQ